MTRPDGNAPGATRTASTPVPERLTLPSLQGYVARIVAERGFTRDLDRVFILFVEELGELAEQVAAGPGPERAAGQVADRAAGHLSKRELGWELADVALYLVDLANGLSQDLASALVERCPGPERSRPDPERATIEEWQARPWAAGGAAPGGALALLMEAAGTLAHCLRKRWAGQESAEAPAALAKALGAVLELARQEGVDLSAAIHEKEIANAKRVWTY